ncbi:MAG: hypothetical protein ACXVCY_11820 [Pseudobdellovibrionaceae bacterium]
MVKVLKGNGGIRGERSLGELLEGIFSSFEVLLPYSRSVTIIPAGQVIVKAKDGTVGSNKDAYKVDVVCAPIVASTSQADDPCMNNPTPGTVCTGGAIYLGSLSPGAASGTGTDRYMTTVAVGKYLPNQLWVLQELMLILRQTSLNRGYHAAARYCDKLSYGGYTDWYLPNRYELKRY